MYYYNLEIVNVTLLVVVLVVCLLLLLLFIKCNVLNIIMLSCKWRLQVLSWEKWRNSSGWSQRLLVSVHPFTFSISSCASWPCAPQMHVCARVCVFAYVYARADEPVKVGIRIHCTILHPSHDCCAFCCN